MRQTAVGHEKGPRGRGPSFHLVPIAPRALMENLLTRRGAPHVSEQALRRWVEQRTLRDACVGICPIPHAGERYRPPRLYGVVGEVSWTRELLCLLLMSCLLTQLRCLESSRAAVLLPTAREAPAAHAIALLLRSRLCHGCLLQKWPPSRTVARTSAMSNPYCLRDCRDGVRCKARPRSGRSRIEHTAKEQRKPQRGRWRRLGSC